MAIVRVNPNLEAELTGSIFTRGPLEHALADVADLIVLEAQAIARTEFYRRGGYLRGLTADHGLDDFGELVARVNATNWKSHFAEWGWKSRTGGERARHVLTRAAERAGFATLGAGLLGPGARGQRALPAPRRLAVTGRR